MYLAAGKRVRLVKGVVSQEVIAAAGDAIGPRLGQDVDDTASRPPELDRVLVGDDLKLLHGLLGEGVARRVRQPRAAARDLVVDVDALEPERLELFVEAAERDRVRRAVGGRGVHRHARGEQREIDELPPLHRQIVEDRKSVV